MVAAATLLFALLPVTAQLPPGLTAMPSGVLIEAESFAPAERWEVQSKLPGFSGKGYLANRGRPAILETTPSYQATVPRAGRYAVWVRAFLGGEPGSGYHDREFAVEVDGTRLAATHLGIEGNGFAWELAGEIAIGAGGVARLRLCDVGRAEALVDCLLLTDAPQFRAPGWAGNSTRPGQGPFVRLPEVQVPRAAPFELAPAPREHRQAIAASPHAYLVNVGGTLDEFNTAQYPKTYGTGRRLESGFQPNHYLVLENAGPGDVVNPRIVIDGRRDWYSAQTILARVLKPGMTDADKALAIWAFAADIAVQCHENNRRVGALHPDNRSHPSRNEFQERGDPVRAANTYYCSGCQYGATTCAVLARAAGLASRCVWMCPFDQYEIHCVAEVFCGARWRLLDPEARAFYLESDNTTLAGYE